MYEVTYWTDGLLLVAAILMNGFSQPFHILRVPMLLLSTSTELFYSMSAFFNVSCLSSSELFLRLKGLHGDLFVAFKSWKVLLMLLESVSRHLSVPFAILEFSSTPSMATAMDRF